MYAALDIGTNSVLLLIADVCNGDICVVHQEAHVTRLGEGTNRSKLLADQAMERTLNVLRTYAERCREAGVSELFACGTAAFRKAANADVFIRRVYAATGIAIEVISEEREARLSYEGSAASFGDKIAVMDIGGGSTEFIVRWKGTIAAQSLDLGVVTIKERFLHSDPPTDGEITAARRYIRTTIEGKLDTSCLHQHGMKLVAAAGTATTLAAMHGEIDPYDPDRIHGASLACKDVNRLIERIQGLPAAEIRCLKGVQKGREDVILAGALITDEAMHHLGYDRFTVSDRGVRWGLLYEKTRLTKRGHE